MYHNKIIFLIALAVLSHLGSVAQNKDAAVVESLNKVIIPLETIKPDSNFSDIGFL